MSRTPITIDNKNEEEKFFEYVNSQIEKFTSYTSKDKTDLTFAEVNAFLRDYEQILLTLISTQTFTMFEYEKMKEDFSNWYDLLHIKIRDRENKSEVAATKWLTAKEIEMYVKKENYEEYTTRKKALLLLEHQLHFINKLLMSWEKQQFVLSTLSKNIQTEVSASIKSY